MMKCARDPRAKVHYRQRNILIHSIIRSWKMSKEVFLMSQNTKIHTQPYCIYGYCVQFADSPACLPHYILVTTWLVNSNFLRVTHFCHSPLHRHPSRPRVAYRLIAHLSWGTSHHHSGSSVIPNTPHNGPCAPSPPIDWKVYVRRRNLEYPIPNA
jgi:hypothetical protein